MKHLHLFLTLMTFLSSCAVYKRQFDCPPDQGVPCTSVTDLEQMIVETPSGPDLFLSTLPASCSTACRKRVWIQEAYAPDGRWIPGHYIELN